MLDAIAGDSLPTPAQMRTLCEASQAVWYARRMREASRAIITGNIALAYSPIFLGPWDLGALSFLALFLAWIPMQEKRANKPPIR